MIILLAMSLFTYVKKPFKDTSSGTSHKSEDDDDDDDDVTFLGRKRKRAKNSLSLTSKTQQEEKKSIVAQSNRNFINLTNIDEEVEVIEVKPHRNNQGTSRNQFEVSTPSLSSKVDAANIPIEIPDDDFLQKAEELLNRVNNAKSTLNIESVDAPHQDSCSSNVVDLVLAPVFKSYTTTSAHNNVNEVTLEDITKMVGLQTDLSITANNNIDDEPVNTLRIKTRLNGKDERKWKICPIDNIGKLKARLSKLYELDASQMKLILDGQAINDSETPENLDIEDDTIIDIKISNCLLKNAIEATNKSELSKGEQSKLASEKELVKLKIKTRLNQKHERKWKISSTDKIGMFKEKFAHVYGLKTAQIKFLLDGIVMSDDSTPQELDIEDETIIDVKIPAHLVKKAVQVASSASN